MRIVIYSYYKLNKLIEKYIYYFKNIKVSTNIFKLDGIIIDKKLIEFNNTFLFF